MHRLLLLNPNTTASTTGMMAGLVQQALGADVTVHGMTATAGVPLITTPAELQASAQQVQALWAQASQAGAHWHAVLVACFGDPGVHRLRHLSGLPVVGLCEPALQQAGAGGRRFGVATTTPQLAGEIAAMARSLGLSPQYTGLRATAGDARALSAAPAALHQALAAAVRACLADGAEAVVIGGGPLGQAALTLAPAFNVPLIAPLACAAQALRAQLSPGQRRSTCVSPPPAAPAAATALP